MQHNIQAGTQEQVVSLSGRITFRDFDGFNSLLNSVGGEAAPKVVFDLSGVEFMDSAALGMILLVRDKLRDKGTAFSLRGSKGQVKRLMEVMKFDQALA